MYVMVELLATRSRASPTLNRNSNLSNMNCRTHRQNPTQGGGGCTGLVVRGSDSGSGDPGSILGRVGVLFP